MARIQHLGKLAMERGSYPIRFTLKDYLDQNVNSGNINEVYLWLTDMNGTPINGRSHESQSVANPLDIVLEDEDLQITDKTVGYNRRIVTLKGTYNSDLGSSLSFVHAVSFDIVNLLVINIDLDVSVIDMAFTGDFVDV